MYTITVDEKLILKPSGHGCITVQIEDKSVEAKTTDLAQAITSLIGFPFGMVGGQHNFIDNSLTNVATE